jgi:hypothetical protein
MVKSKISPIPTELLSLHMLRLMIKFASCFMLGRVHGCGEHSGAPHFWNVSALGLYLTLMAYVNVNVIH